MLFILAPGKITEKSDIEILSMDDPLTAFAAEEGEEHSPQVETEDEDEDEEEEGEKYEC